MVAFTPSLALPYPDGADEPCDFAEQWCDFTQALDSVFDRFQTTLDRIVPMIPIAILSVPLSDPVVITSFNNVPYDTVVMDSAGWTAVDIDNTLISPDMAGVLTFHSSIVVQQANAAGAFILDPRDSLGLVNEPILPYIDSMDNNTAHIGLPLTMPPIPSTGAWTPGATGFRNNAGANPGATLTLLAAQFSIYWHSDGGTL